MGPYQLVNELGRGGQGAVWLAEDTRLHRRVALKVLSGLGPSADKAVERFRREAEVTSRLEHPGICAVYDAGVDDEVPWIAMRYVEGETLSARLARTVSGPDVHSYVDLDSDDEVALGASSAETTTSTREQVMETVEIFEKVARAVHAAHEEGVIHRDLKPGNIIVSTSGDPVVLDFGLARDTEGDLQTLTNTGDFFGTPAYMAPEQLTGRRIRPDRRADVWSLGVALYECLANRRPFHAPTREGLYQAILTKEPQRPARAVPAAPRDLAVVVETALAKDRDRRYQTAAVLADDLAAVRRGDPVTARPVGLIGRCVRWARRRPAAAALAVVIPLAAILIAGSVGFLLAERDTLEAGRRHQHEEAFERELERGFFGLINRDTFSSFERALEMEPDNPLPLALLMLGNNTRKILDEKLDRFSGRLWKHPELARLHTLLLTAARRPADATRRSKDIREPETALEHFLEAVLALPDDTSLARTRVSPERLARSQGHINRAIMMVKRPRSLFHCVRLFIASLAGDQVAATETIDAMSLLWPDRPDVWTAIALCAARLDAETSVEATRRALFVGQPWGSSLIAIGEMLSEEGHHSHAAEVFEQLAEREPNRPGPWMGLALSRLWSGDMDAARRAFDAAEARCGDDVNSLNMVSSAAVRAFDDERAERLLKNARRLAKDARWPVLRLADIELKRFDSKRCVGLLEQAGEQFPDAGIVWDLRAAARIWFGDVDGARAAHATALKKGWTGEMYVLQTLDHPATRAEGRELLRSFKGARRRGHRLALLAAELLKDGQAEGALDLSRKAQIETPRLLMALGVEGAALCALGRADEGRPKLLASVKGHPLGELMIRRRWLADALVEVNDLEAARAALEDWTKLQPRYPIAWHDLAAWLVAHDPEAARDAARRAVDLAVDPPPRFLVTLAHACAACSDAAGARKAAADASRLASDRDAWRLPVKELRAAVAKYR